MSASTSGRRVLVVEDNEDTRQLVSIHLQAVGIQVDECADGAQALSKLSANRPEAMILDLGLPQMSGFEVLQSLKARPAPPVPTLVLTGRRTKEDASQALALGANDYLVKPYDVRQLLVRITRLIVWSRRLQAQELAVA